MEAQTVKQGNYYDKSIFADTTTSYVNVHTTRADHTCNRACQKNASAKISCASSSVDCRTTHASVKTGVETCTKTYDKDD